MRIGFEIKKLHMLISNELRSATSIKAMDDMTNTHGYVLKYLAQNEGKEVFQRDIEKEFMISRPTVSEIIKLMEKNGLIVKEEVASDKRLKKLILTPVAIEKQERMRKCIDDLEIKLRNNISEEELAVFVSVAEKIGANLD